MIKFIGCLFIGAIAGLSIHHTRDPHDSAWWENESLKTELQQRADLLQYRIRNLDHGSDPVALRDAKNALSQEAARLVVLKTRRENLTKAIEAERASMAGYRGKYLQALRVKAAGMEFPEFLCADGRVFADAKVVLVDDNGVSFRHRDGSSRVRYGDLSDDQRNLFGLDGEAASIADRKEAAEVAAYESWLKSEMDLAARAEEEAELEELYLQNKRAKTRRVPARSTAVAANSNTGTLSEPPRRLVENRTYDRNYYRPRTTRYYYHYSTPRAVTLPSPPRSRPVYGGGRPSAPCVTPSGGSTAPSPGPASGTTQITP